MNKKLLFVLPLSCLAVGCVALAPGTCKQYTPPKNCHGKAKAAFVTLHTNTLKANPGCVKAKDGKTIVFHLVPSSKNAEGSVQITPKNAADTWLTGTNVTNEDYIFIPIPDGVSGDHDYKFSVTKGGCVDPRVRVN